MSSRRTHIRVYDYTDKGYKYFVRTMKVENLVECPDCFAIFQKCRRIRTPNGLIIQERDMNCELFEMGGLFCISQRPNRTNNLTYCGL